VLLQEYHPLRAPASCAKPARIRDRSAVCGEGVGIFFHRREGKMDSRATHRDQPETSSCSAVRRPSPKAQSLSPKGLSWALKKRAANVFVGEEKKIGSERKLVNAPMGRRERIHYASRRKSGDFARARLPVLPDQETGPLRPLSAAVPSGAWAPSSWRSLRLHPLVKKREAYSVSIRQQNRRWCHVNLELVKTRQSRRVSSLSVPGGTEAATDARFMSRIDCQRYPD